jgi:hypothetical protein
MSVHTVVLSARVSVSDDKMLFLDAKLNSSGYLILTSARRKPTQQILEPIAVT